jgi:hypothetical protein
MKGRMIALLLLSACGADTAARDGGTDATLEDALADAGLLEDAMVRDALAALDAPGGHNPEACDVTLGATTATEATVHGHISCMGQAVAIVQVGVGSRWGGNDSPIVDCDTDFEVTLPLAPALGPAGAWAMIDTLEWPFTMDDGDITHCGTAGSPPE